MFEYEKMSLKTRLVVAFFNLILLGYLVIFKHFPFKAIIFVFSPLFIIIAMLGYKIEKLLEKNKKGSG
ncbi:MAG: hypothetical protein GX347_02800 [Epulopiscium sp.]|nr:hypothetical protein [Candidatus Epulonipiscium sp.]